MITLLFIKKLPSNKQMKQGRELCIDHHQSKHVFITSWTEYEYLGSFLDLHNDLKLILHII